jgi:plasmid stabilization system protein ParE
MRYEVVLTSEAQENARAAYDWYAARSPDAANQWHAMLLEKLTALEADPQRWPLADENARFPIELRQLPCGSGRRITHRIIFAIRPTKVVVYAIRHVAQQDWRPTTEES